MVSFDSSEWSAEMLRRRPNAPDAIRTAMELLTVPSARWQDVADDIYHACADHFAPMEIQSSQNSPSAIWESIERIAKAAETIERELEFLREEARPLPRNLGTRSVVVRYMRHEIVRALGERLVPPMLRADDRVGCTLPHQFPEDHHTQDSIFGRHAWQGQFKLFADTVRNVVEYVRDVTEGKGLDRPRGPRPDFEMVRLVAALQNIFERETGGAATIWRDPGIYEHRIGRESDFALFVKAVWPATEHPDVTIDALKSALSEARKFPE